MTKIQQLLEELRVELAKLQHPEISLVHPKGCFWFNTSKSIPVYSQPGIGAMLGNSPCFNPKVPTMVMYCGK